MTASKIRRWPSNSLIINAGCVQGANFAFIYGKTKAMGYRNITLPAGHTWKSYTKFLLDTLPERLRNNYAKKFNTSIQFWSRTGGGLDESVIQELQEKGYQIKQNGVSNYTLNKKSRIPIRLHRLK